MFAKDSARLRIEKLLLVKWNLFQMEEIKVHKIQKASIFVGDGFFKI